MKKRQKAKIDRICGHLAVALDRRCVVCGSLEQLEAGHYFSRIPNSTRFDMRNIYCQCKKCNRLHENNAEPLRKAVLSWLTQEDFDALQRQWWVTGIDFDPLALAAYMSDLLETVLCVYRDNAKIDIWGPYQQTVDIVVVSKIPEHVWVRKMFRPETFALPKSLCL